ncbi:MAG: hypothetical protein U9O53_00345, partial [archaeon]|nr:hypothetical protein [archaeon]
MAYFSAQKKGLSPLIAVVLLVVFTIGIATIIMSWMNSYTKDTTYQATQDSAGVIGCAGVNVEIDEVYILSDNTIKVIARNTGLKPLIFKEGYVWDTNGTRCILNVTASTVEKGVSFELINDSCP